MSTNKTLITMLFGALFLGCTGGKKLQYETRPPEKIFGVEIQRILNPADKGDSFLVAPHTKDRRSLRIYSFQRRFRLVLENWFRPERALVIEKKDSLGNAREVFRTGPSHLIWREIEPAGQAFARSLKDVSYLQIAALLEIAGYKSPAPPKSDSIEARYKRRVRSEIGKYTMKEDFDALRIDSPTRRISITSLRGKPRTLRYRNSDTLLLEIDFPTRAVAIVKTSGGDPLLITGGPNFGNIHSAARIVFTKRTSHAAPTERELETLFNNCEELFEKYHDLICPHRYRECGQHRI